MITYTRNLPGNPATNSEPNQSGYFILSLSLAVCYPPEIKNGDTEPSLPLQPGEKLLILCSEGHSLNVMPNIVCQEDGTFGDTAIPQCIGLSKSINYSSMPHLINIPKINLLNDLNKVDFMSEILNRIDNRESPNRRSSRAGGTGRRISPFDKQCVLNLPKLHHFDMS